MGWNDTLYGSGNDTLSGGGGANTYVESSATNRIDNSGGNPASMIIFAVAYDLSSSFNGGLGNTNGVNNLVYTEVARAVRKGNSKANAITGGTGKDTI